MHRVASISTMSCQSCQLSNENQKAYGLFNCSNTLYPSTFPGVRKFEAEVVTMTLGIVGGHACGAEGLLSSGGTESIILAVLACELLLS